MAWLDGLPRLSEPFADVLTPKNEIFGVLSLALDGDWASELSSLDVSLGGFLQNHETKSDFISFSEVSMVQGSKFRVMSTSWSFPRCLRTWARIQGTLLQISQSNLLMSPTRIWHWSGPKTNVAPRRVSPDTLKRLCSTGPTTALISYLTNLVRS